MNKRPGPNCRVAALLKTKALSEMKDERDSIVVLCGFIQGGRGQWTFYFSSPQSFIIVFSYSLIRWLNYFRDFSEFWLVGSLIWVSRFQTLIVIYRRGNFGFNHWGWIFIYQALSYSFRSLVVSSFKSYGREPDKYNRKWMAKNTLI